LLGVDIRLPIGIDQSPYRIGKNFENFVLVFILLHRVIEWVDFSPIFESPAAFVVVAVGMWATRLRCPSCAQRCLSYGHDLIEGGAALLIAISMTDEGPMESCDATIALAACR
jgi:hypothetical protein